MCNSHVSFVKHILSINLLYEILEPLVSLLKLVWQHILRGILIMVEIWVRYLWLVGNLLLEIYWVLGTQLLHFGMKFAAGANFSFYFKDLLLGEANVCNFLPMLVILPLLFNGHNEWTHCTLIFLFKLETARFWGQRLLQLASRTRFLEILVCNFNWGCRAVQILEV